MDPNFLTELLTLCQKYGYHAYGNVVSADLATPEAFDIDGTQQG